MRHLLFILLSACFILAGSSHLAAQDTSKITPKGKTYVIQTTDGGIVKGQIISDDGEEIVIRTESMGVVTVKRSSVKSITESDGTEVLNPKGWYENPLASRYVAGASAIPQRKGTGYYQNMYLFFSAANYGITDHVSVSVGTEIASVFVGDLPQAVCISPRVGYRLRPKLYVGGGVLYTYYGGNGGYANGIHNFLATGLITYGTRDNNITAGFAWTLINGRYYTGGGNYERKTLLANQPSFMLSGMWRPLRWLELVTENWAHTPPFYNSRPIFSGDYYGDFYYSAGVRFMAKNFSFDLGMMNNPDWSFWRWGVPYVGFTINFQTKAARSVGAR